MHAIADKSKILNNSITVASIVFNLKLTFLSLFKIQNYLFISILNRTLCVFTAVISIYRMIQNPFTTARTNIESGKWFIHTPQMAHLICVLSDIISPFSHPVLPWTACYFFAHGQMLLKWCCLFRPECYTRTIVFLLT